MEKRPDADYRRKYVVTSYSKGPALKLHVLVSMIDGVFFDKLVSLCTACRREFDTEIDYSRNTSPANLGRTTDLSAEYRYTIFHTMYTRLIRDPSTSFS